MPPSCGIRGAPEPRFLNRTAHGLLRWAERHSHLSYASVHHGAQHHVGEFFLSSQSNSGFWVDPESVSVSEASEKVAGVN